MSRSLTRRINLRRLILLIALISAFAALISTFRSGYVVQRQQLIDQTLENGFHYANKLADSTDDFLTASLQQLGVAAQVLSRHFADPARVAEEASRLHTQTDSFNSVVITNAKGDVLATSPNTLGLVGRRIETVGITAALQHHQPLISAPYLSSVGNFLIFLSQPVISADGEFLGTVGGSIYLKQDSILNRLLGVHAYRDGSYLYVIDSTGTILYHPQTERVGEHIQGNAAIDAVRRGESGSTRVTNSKGVDMLAGYAPIPQVGWGIVAQRPVAATLAPLDALMEKMLIQTIPFALLIFVLVWWCATKVAQPLQQLASQAGNMADGQTTQRIRVVRPWYFEAQELKRVMLLGVTLLNQTISQLREDAQTDPLTGLANRRSLEAALTHSRQTGQRFAVISVDIDHFKRVNDTYGHDAGDQVLRELGQQMLQCSRQADLACRIGGEEFLIFLPVTDTEVATQVAERLRQRVEAMSFGIVGHITISLGVASWPHDHEEIQTVLKYADQMLYQAKRQGRNRVEAYAATPAHAGID